MILRPLARRAINIALNSSNAERNLKPSRDPGSQLGERQEGHQQRFTLVVFQENHCDRIFTGSSDASFDDGGLDNVDRSHRLFF
jgi:hypothetical protein